MAKKKNNLSEIHINIDPTTMADIEKMRKEQAIAGSKVMRDFAYMFDSGPMHVCAGVENKMSFPATLCGKDTTVQSEFKEAVTCPECLKLIDKAGWLK